MQPQSQSFCDGVDVLKVTHSTSPSPSIHSSRLIPILQAVQGAFVLLCFLVLQPATLIGATADPGTNQTAITLRSPVRIQSQLKLEWIGGTPPYQLEESSNPTGPWQTVGALLQDSFTLVSVSQPKRFFRITSTGSSTNSTMSPEESSMRATLDAVGTFVNSVTTTNRAEWRTTILTFLNNRPDIDGAGETPDGIWAITQDGIPLAIWKNRVPDPGIEEDPISPAQLAGTETPGTRGARFAVTVGNGFKQSAPRLSRLVGGNGYSPTSDAAPLDSLKGKQNASIFFFNTHGGTFVMPIFGANGKPQRGPNGKIQYENAYALWSGTKIDPRFTAPEYRHDEFVTQLKAKQLAIAFAPASSVTDSAGNTVNANEWRFGITAQWVRSYLSFPRENHASVWLAACQSGLAAAAPMRAAFRAVGAEMVSSWTGYVDGDAVLSATSFLYDRLLGANKVQAPATPQRPFDYENAWTELRSKGLHRFPTIDDNNKTTTVDIVYEGDSGDNTFGLFAPSIEYALIDEEKDQAHLIGLFGNPSADARKVTIQGTEVGIVTWEPRKIVCSLNRTGAASAGDVQVIVNGHESNKRRITRWTIHGTYKMTEEDAPHVIDGTFSIIYRADVGEYRKVPGNVFIRPTRYAIGAQHSDIHLEAKGVETHPCDRGQSETTTWHGSGKFPTYDPEGPYTALAWLSLNTIDRYGAIALDFGLRDPDAFPLKVTYKPCDGPSVTFPVAPGPSGPVNLQDPLMFGFPLDEPLPDGSHLEIPLPGGSFIIGNDWSLEGGSADSEIHSGIKWSSAAAEFPPLPDAAR